jgi:hypothetical protein
MNIRDIINLVEGLNAIVESSGGLDLYACANALCARLIDDGGLSSVLSEYQQENGDEYDDDPFGGSAGDPFGDGPGDLEHLWKDPDFREWLQAWCHGRVGMAFHNLRDMITGGHIIGYRKITASVDWQPSGRHPGIYWAWDKDIAEAYWAEGSAGQVEWLMTANIPESSIDWMTTVLMNAHPEFEVEQEIRLLANAPVDGLRAERVND